MLHLLSCLTTFNLVMHHIRMCIMPCLRLCVYHVVCFFPVVLLLDSSAFDAIVRIRSSTLVRLLHGLDILPSRILGKMIMTLDISTIAICLVAIAMSRFLPHICQPLICHDTASNHPTQ